MDDLNDPRISAYRPQRRLRVPAPPGSRHKPSKAEHKRKEQAAARAEARAARLHLAGLTSAAMIIMGLILAAVVVTFAVVLISRR